MLVLLRFDWQITKLLNTLLPHNYFFNLFFSFFSLRGNSILIWIIIVLFLIIFEERKNPGISAKDKRFILCFALSFLITTLFVNVIIKNIVKRSRPLILKSEDARFEPIIESNLNQRVPVGEKRGIALLTNYSCPKDYSFPSSHAATAFAAATVFAVFDKKRKYFYYLLAILISFSRLYLGCHFFFDVLAGGVIGYLISKTILKSEKYPIERNG